MMREGLGEWVRGVLESAVYQDFEPSFTQAELGISSHRHECGQSSAD